MPALCPAPPAGHCLMPACCGLSASPQLQRPHPALDGGLRPSPRHPQGHPFAWGWPVPCATWRDLCSPGLGRQQRDRPSSGWPGLPHGGPRKPLPGASLQRALNDPRGEAKDRAVVSSEMPGDPRSQLGVACESHVHCTPGCPHSFPCSLPEDWMHLDGDALQPGPPEPCCSEPAQW